MTGLTEAYKVEERDRFGSRLAFYMAAVGSAVGFGNVWRFPYLCFSFGGAAFLIPYLLSLIFIGIPILFLEIGLGQYHQTGDVGVFGSFNIRLRGVGLCSVIAGFTLLSYYSMLISWCMNAFVDSWRNDAPWRNDTLDGDAAIGYFYNNITGLGTSGPDYKATRLVPANVGYSFFTWLLVFVSIAFGSKITGRITYFTMGFPILLLFIFLFKGISLEGSSDGIDYYIGSKSSIDALWEKPTVWTEAVTQIFFTLSVTFGTMTAYGSLVPRTESAFKNSIIIAVANCSFSFIAGFAVFASIGHLAYLKGVDVTNVNFRSFGLVFGTWPVVLGSLPGGIHWVRLLFLNLILLGIDSAFSILEGVVTVMGDTTFFNGKPKWVVTAVFSSIGFFCSLLYAIDTGLIWLDTIDYYINFMLLLIGLIESFSAGWMYGLEKQVKKLGATCTFCFMFANFGGAALGGGLWFGLKRVWPGFVGYISLYVAFTVLAFLTMKPDVENKIYTLFFENVMDLKAELQLVIGWVPTAWAMLIKHFIPQILLILFINGLTAKGDDGKPKFGNYSGFAQEYQQVGISCVVWIAAAFLIGVAFPSVYKPFAIFENSGKEFGEATKTVDDPEDAKESGVELVESEA